MKKCYYDILGINKDASDNDIKKAYRKMAMKYHPDKYANSSSEEKSEAENRFKEINEANQILSDQGKRQMYDRFGHQAFEQGGGQSGRGFDGFDFGGFGFGEDIFEGFFGGRRQQRGPQPGDSLGYQLDVTIEEIAFGCEKTIKFVRNILCKTCNGTGAKNESSITTCSKCNGSGRTVVIQQTMMGTIRSEQVCPHCSGSGKMIKDKCLDCNGNKFMQEEVQKKIKVNAGMDSGNKMKITGMGNDSLYGGPTGDLYVIINVLPHERYGKIGIDVYTKEPISYLTAVIGGNITVKTLYGEKVIKIPAGTESGRRFSIPDEGVPHIKYNKKGSHIIEVMIDIPKNIDEESIEILKSFDSKVYNHAN